MTNTPSKEGAPVWSPDDQMLAYFVDTGGVSIQRVAGGDPVSLVELENIHITHDWTPDGKSILFSQIDTKTQSDLWLIPPHAGARPVPWLQTRFYETVGRLSPDGKWVVYRSNASGSNEIYVSAFQNPTERVQISSGGGVTAVWSHTGREIFYATSKDELYVVAVDPGQPFEAEPPRLLFKETGAAIWDGFDVTRDDQKFVIIRARSGPSTNPLHVIVNWKRLLEKD
jgi:TolB protein